jgi:3-oxoadipate enol-lactonase
MNLTVVGPEGAPPLVLSNALGTSAELWDRQVAAFSRRFAVVRYEQVARPSVAELADSILDALARVGMQRMSFCGISLGAMVGMSIAADAPQRLDRLVLACTSARFGDRQEWSERAALVRSGGIESVAREALDRWFTPAYADREPFLRMQLQTPREDYALGLEAIGEFDFRDRLGEVRAPTLVIAGAQDTATPTADAELIASEIPGAQLRVLEDAAHLANVERADAFNLAVLEHLWG